MADRPLRRSELVDGVLRAAFAAQGGTGLALAAVGGYGRGELWPGSDVDLLMIHDPGDERRAEEVFEGLLYPLWDAGVSVGHAVRTVAECRAEAAARLESLTALIDARWVAGRAALVDDARGAARDLATGDPDEFGAALREDRIRREALFGRLGEGLEPNLKDGAGGLRDARVSAWMAMARGGPEAGPEERSAERFIGAVREALHSVPRSPGDRLAADLHAAVAERLDLSGETGWEPRDLLMRRVAESGRCLDAVATAHLEPRSPPATPDLDRMEPFVAVAERGGAIAVDDLRRGLARRITPAAIRSRDVAADLVRILAAGDGGARTIGLLDQFGLMEAVVPVWASLRGRPQRDPYHRFAVDSHLVQTAAHAARLLFRPHEPFARQAVALVDDAAPVLLGALLHDVGKVGRGSHVSTGADLAAAIAEDLRLAPATKEDVVFLVREHLLLSDTATRRDLEDEDLVVRMAARIGDPRRLAMLYLLSVADASATGPAASTPWRLGLVRDLVSKVQRAFEHGAMDRDRSVRVEEAERGLAEALARSGAAPDRIEGFLRSAPLGYLLWAHDDDVSSHLALVDPAPGPVEVRTIERPSRTAGTWTLTVAARDRPGLLASVAGSLTLSGLTVLSAQAFTTASGVALDGFEVAGAFEADISPERWRRFRTTLRHALEGRVDVRDRIARLRDQYRPGPTDVPVTVRLDEDASDFHTVVEVGGPDRLGLLFELARAIADQGYDVHLAKVATYGPRVVDSFYVTDSDGRKLTRPGAAVPLVEALRRAAGG